jgi:glucokinase
MISASLPGFRSTRSASLAVAVPIDDKNGSVIITNWSGNPEARTIKVADLPQKLFQSNTILLNDLKACAFGIVSAHNSNTIQDLFNPIWPDICPSGPILSNSRTAVLAMGSGLGIAVILNNLKSPFALSTELGHLQVPSAGAKNKNFKKEDEIFQYISEHYYKRLHEPEYEDFSSGRGLYLFTNISN